jgi:hypothetical protein
MGSAASVAEVLDDAWALAFTIIMGEFEGSKWDWVSMRWEEPRT